MIFNGLSDVNFGSGVQIATGSYVGTDTYGQNNPNTLTFEFVPKIVFIIGMDGTYSYSGLIQSEIGGTYNRVATNNTSIVGCKLIASCNGKTIAWYTASTAANSQEQQLNRSNIIYHYAALGTGG